MDDESENNVYNWIKVFDDTPSIKPLQSTFQKTPTQARVFQFQEQFPTDMEGSFSPDFVSDSPELSLTTRATVARDDSLPEQSNTKEPEVSSPRSTLEVRGSTPDSSIESFSVNSPSLLTWQMDEQQEYHDEAAYSTDGTSLIKISNIFCICCKSWARDGINCSDCVTTLIMSRRSKINKCEVSNKLLVDAAKALDNLKNNAFREQQKLRIVSRRRRVIALQQLLNRERMELEALSRANEEKQSDLQVKRLKLKIEEEKLNGLKLLLASHKGIDLQAKVNIIKKEETLLHKEQRRYILNGLMQLLPVDIIKNSINGIIIPRNVTPSCVYIPNLDQIYGYIIIYTLKLEQFYTSRHLLRTRLSYQGTRSMISDGKQQYALYLKCNSKRGVKNYQKAIHLFDKELLELATIIGVPRHCLKKFCLIGNLWNVLVFVHEHRSREV